MEIAPVDPFVDLDTISPAETAVDLDTISPAETAVDLDTISPVEAVPVDSLIDEVAPVDPFIDTDPVADEIAKEIPLDLVEMIQVNDPVPEWAMESARIDAGSTLEMQILGESNNPWFGEVSPPTNGDDGNEAPAQPPLADVAVESSMEPTSQALGTETDTVGLVASISESESETLDGTLDETLNVSSDVPVYRDEADATISELLGQLAMPRAELKSWLEILTAPTENPIEIAHATAGYIGAITHVQAASEAAHLPSLVALCTQIARNVEALAKLDASARLAARAVMEEWPSVVLAYLDDPADEDLCLAVITHLSRPVWPHPLSEDEAAELVALLAPDDDDSLVKAEVRPTLARPEDVALALGDDVNPRLRAVFLQEAPANAARFTECVERISRGEEVSQNLGVAQRLAHNLKGSANMIGIKGVANLTHHLEDILEYLSEQQLAPPPPLANTLQEGADCIEAMLEALQGLSAPPPDALRILQDIYDWANRIDTGQIEAMLAVSKDVSIPTMVPTVADTEPSLITSDTTPDPIASDTESVLSVLDAIQAVSYVAKAERAETVAPPTTAPATQAGAAEAMLQVPAATFDALFRLVGEFSISIDQLQERLRAVQRQSNELHNQDLLIQQRRFELESFVDVRHVAAVQQRFHRSNGHEHFDPLELDEYDELYGATRSFVETVTDSRKMLSQLRGELTSVEHLFVQVQRMKRELQQVVMRTHMEPVSILGARLARSVRQACRTTGKQAELLLEGADVLLDSEVLNKLVDPLMHMLRNAVDHGIERPEQRIAAGKPATGIVRLRFFQEGHHVVIDCTDDGGGLNYAHIRETAAKKGLANLDTTDHQALARLVLMPGFTTRTTATQLSGRGVGLDVVNSAIKELKGIMEIGDNQPIGCQIKLRVPLSLMTHYCLVVEVAGRQYAIPTSTVDRALPPKVGQFSQVGSEVAYDLDRHIYPARSLRAYLQDARTNDGDFNAQKAVLLAYSDMGLVALAIDRVIDSYHLVVRSLGRHVKTARGVAGVSSLPDGRLIPVLDLAELLRASMEEAASVARSRPAASELATLAAPHVLIVDDSLSVRQSLAELMTESGYQPLLARDGVEAVEMLRKQPPDIVLTDIEMPRMNGLELASYIRATHGTTLPIVTITSRTMQKHRQLAQQVGVDLYLTKPFAEDQLLSGIRSLLH